MKNDDDISKTLEAKSDQLNAADLLGGPITVTITAYKIVNDEKQPVWLSIGLQQPDGKDKPWKPCKTVRRLLVAAWETPKVSEWVGRSVRLNRDASVVYSAKEVGGIRVEAASHLAKPFEMMLAEVRGKPKQFVIQPLKASPPKSQEQKKQTQQVDLRGSFKAMKDRWKSRQKDRGQTADIDSFSTFVNMATSGLVPAGQALNVPSYTEELIEKCVASISETMPEQF